MRVKYAVSRRKGERQALVHRQIAEKALGRPLPTSVIVHHHDGIGVNNQNSNLVICENTAYHALLHKRQRVLNAGGDPNIHALCGGCKSLQSPADMLGSRCLTCRRRARIDRSVHALRDPKTLLPDFGKGKKRKWWGWHQESLEAVVIEPTISYTIPLFSALDRSQAFSEIQLTDEINPYVSWRPKMGRTASYLDFAYRRRWAAIIVDTLLGLEALHA